MSTKLFLLESIDLKTSETIVEQMKKYVCMIFYKGITKGIGSFCKIPFPDKENLLTVLITNNQVIDESILNDKNSKIVLSMNNEKEVKEIELKNRKNYTNKDYDITFIEINEADKINNFLEIDEDFQNSNQILPISKEIYLLHYPKSNNVKVSYGKMTEIKEDKNNFHHSCSTEVGVTGSPILNLSNCKLLGIHKNDQKIENYNIGIYINNPIKDFHEKIKKQERDNILKHYDIGKLAVLRLIKEYEIYCKNPISNCINVGPIADNDFLHWKATLVGPDHSPYKNGVFF